MQLEKENAIEEMNSLTIREEVEKYVRYWPWFVLGAVISLGIAFLYLRYTTPQYIATTSILIKDNRKSGISKELEVFKDLGIIGGSSSNNPDNEIEILKSRKILRKAIHELNLTTAYFREGRVKKVEIYKSTVPVEVVFISKNALLKDLGLSFKLYLKSEEKFELKNKEDVVISSHEFGELITNKLGDFKVLKTENFNSNSIGQDIFVDFYNITPLINSYKSRVVITSISKESSILKLSIQDPVKQKAEDFLNELVRQYNISAIDDKNEVSKKTKEFIDKRLTGVFKDLKKIQDKVKSYKAKNNISGLSKEGELALENASLNNEKIIAVKLEVDLAKWIKNHLNEEHLKDEALPQNFGFSNQNISLLIENYNKLINEKNRLRLNAGEKNPKIVQIQTEINSLKNNLKRSVSNLEYALAIKLKQLNKEASIVNAKIASIPDLERGIVDIAREQEIISGLYSYLLKKKEEIAISLAITVPNAKIIDVAYGSNTPVSPKKKIVYLAALLFGLLIPFIVIYFKNLLDTKVHSRKDIEDLTNIPFLGDIPHSETEEKIVITSGSRTATAEAFRLVRTNLDFLLPNLHEENGGQTIFITSTTSGEGKSFVALNLAAAMQLSGKKVLLMGMDLRAPKITTYLGLADRKGVSNYITDISLTLNDLKFTTPEMNGLDIIASGVIPPNPAELLLSKRVNTLFKQVRSEYDYIIVDTAPVGLVTDTLLISENADTFLYIARANYIDKRMLKVAQTLYSENKLKNMALILNDTDMTRSYGYGYGYGYGNNYIEQVKKPWYKRIFN